MQKFRVQHWMGHTPPHPKAVKEDDLWTFQLTIEGVMTLTKEYDVMIPHYIGDDLPVMWLDNKGGKFCNSRSATARATAQKKADNDANL